jgi:hypothetical protein
MASAKAQKLAVKASPHNASNAHRPNLTKLLIESKNPIMTLGRLLELDAIGKLFRCCKIERYPDKMRCALTKWVTDNRDTWTGGWPKAFSFMVAPLFPGTDFKKMSFGAHENVANIRLGERTDTGMALLRHSLAALNDPHCAFEGIVLGSFALHEMMASPHNECTPPQFEPSDVDVYMCYRPAHQVASACVGYEEIVRQGKTEENEETNPPRPPYLGWTEYIVGSDSADPGSIYASHKALKNRDTVEYMRTAQKLLEQVRINFFFNRNARKTGGTTITKAVMASLFQVHRVVYPMLRWLRRLNEMNLQPTEVCCHGRPDLEYCLMHSVLPHLSASRLDDLAFELWNTMTTTATTQPVPNESTSEESSNPQSDPMWSRESVAALNAPHRDTVRTVVTFVVPQLAPQRVQFILNASKLSTTEEIDRCRGLVSRYLADTTAAQAPPPPADAARTRQTRIDAKHAVVAYNATAFASVPIACAFDLTICMVGIRIGQRSEAAARPWTGSELSDAVVTNHVHEMRLHYPDLAFNNTAAFRWDSRDDNAPFGDYGNTATLRLTLRRGRWTKAVLNAPMWHVGTPHDGGRILTEARLTKYENRGFTIQESSKTDTIRRCFTAHTHWYGENGIAAALEMSPYQNHQPIAISYTKSNQMEEGWAEEQLEQLTQEGSGTIDIPICLSTRHECYGSRAETRVFSYGVARHKYSELMALAYMGYAPPSATHGDPAMMEVLLLRWRQDLTNIAGLAWQLAVHGDGEIAWSYLTANAVHRLYNFVYGPVGIEVSGPVDVQVIGIKQSKFPNGKTFTR